MLPWFWLSCLLTFSNVCAVISLKTANDAVSNSELGSGPKPSLAFIKVPKTGGSTFGGVLRRIGAKNGYAHVHDDGILQHNHEHKNTSVWAHHGHRRDLGRLIEKHMLNPLYITSLRDPTARCLSAYYHFEVGGSGGDPDDTNAKVKHVKDCTGHFQLDYIREHVHQNAKKALAAYDFILVTERFDESLLALKRVLAKAGLRVPSSDFLYLKAKVSGEGAMKGSGETRPEHPDISSEPSALRHACREVMGNSRDAHMFAKANTALDSFKIPQSEVAEFQEALRVVSERCADDASAHECLWHDGGCGLRCIDSVIAEHGWD